MGSGCALARIRTGSHRPGRRSRRRNRPRRGRPRPDRRRRRLPALGRWVGAAARGLAIESRSGLFVVGARCRLRRLVRLDVRRRPAGDASSPQRCAHRAAGEGQRLRRSADRDRHTEMAGGRSAAVHARRLGGGSRSPRRHGRLRHPRVGVPARRWCRRSSSARPPMAGPVPTSPPCTAITCAIQGIGLFVQGLIPGNYDLAVFAWSTEPPTSRRRRS